MGWQIGHRAAVGALPAPCCAGRFEVGKFRMAARQTTADPRFTAAVVPTYVLAGLVEVARERGLRHDAWFSGTGLTAQQAFDPNTRVSYRQAAQVIRRAVRAHPRSDLGLAVGSRESLVSFGVLGFAMLSCRTLADALQIGMEHHQISGSLMDPAFEVEGDELQVSARERFADVEILPFLCEELFASTLMLMRSLVGPEFRPRRFEVSYAAPAYAERYRQLFGCPLRFGADSNRVIVDARWLAYPLKTHNPITLAHALRLCREQTGATRGDDDVVSSVAQWLRGRLHEGPDMALAARELNLSERTLRRRLSERGVSFRTLCDRVREETATALLRDGDDSIAGIAAQLGFSDAREFRRAFRRWTGRRPSDLRSDQRSRQASAE
jgi:AraC-like DNA-binding protein